jgi:hypothetical protein
MEDPIVRGTVNAFTGGVAEYAIDDGAKGVRRALEDARRFI